MPSSLIATTLQAATLAALSNLLAQLIKPDTNIDFTAIFRFALFSLITTPPNVKWQEYLENAFPGTTTDAKGVLKTNKLNTAKKVVLDQTLGAMVNSAAFIAFFAVMAGKDAGGAWMAVRKVSWHGVG